MAATKTLRELAENVRLIVKPGEARKPWEKRDQWQKGANDYRCTLVYQGRRYSFDFWQGVGIETDPEVVGVLECLLSDEVQDGETFADWCREFGYSADSIADLRTFRACKRQTERLRKLLGDDYETFAQADRN